MAQKRLSGVAYLTVDGTTIPAKGSFVVPLTTVNRTDVVVGDKVLGYDEQYIAPYVQCTVQITDTTDFEKICESTSMTVRVEFANGRIYTLANAFVRGNPTLAETGEASFDFAGENGQWS
nr:MAG TPA: Tail tube [Bacteriophage sp.]